MPNYTIRQPIFNRELKVIAYHLKQLVYKSITRMHNELHVDYTREHTSLQIATKSTHAHTHTL